MTRDDDAHWVFIYVWEYLIGRNRGEEFLHVLAMNHLLVLVKICVGEVIPASDTSM